LNVADKAVAHTGQQTMERRPQGRRSYWAPRSALAWPGHITARGSIGPPGPTPARLLSRPQVLSPRPWSSLL